MESGSSVGEILQKFGETAVNTNERTELIIFRKKILESAFLEMARPAFKLNAKIYIKFSGEIGQDYGGPRREFFRLAMKELAMSTMFEGKSGNGNIPVTFEELLAFITGADKVPSCGFSKAIDISFYPVEHGVYRLPHVSTCSLELHLPRGIDDIKAFQELMIRALKESMVFEKI
ncbi:hypothetical protein FSP39_011220 [Pinctada imbricata]|uniref:HECT-type E3 ubiquitin transferase n=1 Tax=Pinctada imbricata TaxID=66713 RepID=A0AA88YI73_PINIB|nr:hypothetical protein FSP39_011220 [Pinctada imbricata]